MRGRDHRHREGGQPDQRQPAPGRVPPGQQERRGDEHPGRRPDEPPGVDAEQRAEPHAGADPDSDQAQPGQRGRSAQHAQERDQDRHQHDQHDGRVGLVGLEQGQGRHEGHGQRPSRREQQAPRQVGDRAEDRGRRHLQGAQGPLRRLAGQLGQSGDGVDHDRRVVGRHTSTGEEVIGPPHELPGVAPGGEQRPVGTAQGEQDAAPDQAGGQPGDRGAGQRAHDRPGRAAPAGGHPARREDQQAEDDEPEVERGEAADLTGPVERIDDDGPAQLDRHRPPPRTRRVPRRPRGATTTTTAAAGSDPAAPATPSARTARTVTPCSPTCPDDNPAAPYPRSGTSDRIR